MRARLVGGGVPVGSGPVALLLHGGGAHGRDAPRLSPYLRMLPFGWALQSKGIPTRFLRYRHRGWNGADRDPVQDVLWALEQMQAPQVILIGHSMGGRAALWCGGDPRVTAVIGLAPWIEPADPWQQLAGKPVLLIHGSRDRITDPHNSRELATRLGARFESIDDNHAMLSHPRQWSRLLTDFAASVLTLPAS